MLSILRVRAKWLIFNMVSQLWADVKYHVPTGIGFRRRRDIPLAYFQWNDKLQLVLKHAKGISYVMIQFFTLTPIVIDLNYYYKRVEKIWKKENKSLSLQ